MEDKQTAVQWLISQVMYEYEIYTDEEGDFIDKPKIAYYGSHQECTDLSEFVKKALEIEKEQMKDAFVECYKANVPDGFECKLDAEQYYNETYGK